jgi:hypothetical protein
LQTHYTRMKKSYLFLLFIFSSYFAAHSQSYIISTIAGNDTAGFSGDGGQATAAELNQPYGVAVDKAGNVYEVERNNQCVRKITTSGIITTVAGIGTKNGYHGDGGQATAAELNYPTGVAVDTLGNIYIADLTNNRIRKVNAAGIISTFAGDGTASFSGDGGGATAAELNAPSGVAVDALGNVLIADFYNYRVRKVSTLGKISTVAGNGTYGFSGDGGAATAAEIKSFIGVAVDKPGNIYIADQANGRIRKVNTLGTMSTFAGDGTQSYSGDGGLATAAELSYPYGAGTDASGNVYIADYGNERVRYVPKTNIISTIAGISYPGWSGDGGPATAAEISTISGVAIDAAGNVYIADQTNNCIRKLTPVATGINQVTSANEPFTVYPNPGNGKFTFEVKNEKLKVKNIEVFTISGERVYSQFNIQNLPLNIDLSSKSEGVYLYRVSGDDGKIIGEGKIIIQK